MNIRKLFISFVHNKIQQTTIVFSILLILLFSNIFYIVTNTIDELAEKTTQSITEDIKYSINLWIKKRISTINDTAKTIEQNKLYEEKEQLKTLSSTFIKENPQFNAMQILITNKYLVFNGMLIHDYRKNPILLGDENEEVISHEWYKKTIVEKKTTLTTLLHGLLNTTTINLCSPIIKENPIGVICGVITTDSFFEKNKDLETSSDIYYFLTDHKGKLLTNIKNKATENQIEKNLLKNLANKNSKENIINFNLPNNDIVRIRPIKNFNWYIGIGIKKDEKIRSTINKITTISFFIMVSFIILILGINFFHIFLRRKFENQKNEYEYLLDHKIKMCEIGELISGINHQLYQPLNSLKLLLSITYSQSKNKILTQKKLETNLQMCQESISMMSKTIDVFRNFYKFSEEIKEFDLIQSINNVLRVLETDLKRENIKVEIVNKLDDNYKVKSIENFIQQILLVLLHNSKDALNKKINSPSKLIKISVLAIETTIIIDVFDWGEGIDRDTKNKLFEQINKSKKECGSGLGLYFAKKLANKKLKGNLTLLRLATPTIFRFTFNANIGKRIENET